jgi:hypothetical protein
VIKRFYPEHLKKKRRRISLLVLAIIVLIVLGTGAFLYRREKTEVSWLTYRNEDLKVTLIYPENFSKNTLSEEGINAGYLLRIFREKPPAIFSLRYEGGLGVLQSAAGKNILDYLVSEINLRYPDRFPDYQKVGFQEMVLDRERAAQFDFTYTGADGKTKMKQRFVVVVRGDTAFYLSAQAPENDFFKSENDFAKIISSFKFLSS